MCSCLFTVPVLGKDSIIVAGTGDSQQLLGALAKAFQADYPGKHVIIPDSIGSSGGIKATASGKCDLGRVARPLKESEKKYNLGYRLFAYTSVVFVVNSNVNSVDNLTDQQIVDIYSGKTTDWQEIGGHVGKIFVANRETGDASRIILERTIVGFKDISTFAGEVLFSTPDTVRTVAKYENTIGYVPLAMTTTLDLKILKLNGFPPSPENILSGKYPLSVPLGIVWKGELTGLARDFVAFIIGTKGRKIITQNGAVPTQ